MNLSFENKVALVTGAGSGMGLATAKAFAEAGAAVVLADINEQAVRSAAEALISAGHQAIAVRCNVADEAEVAAMVEHTVSTFGRLDAAFNNAGVQSPAVEMADATGEEFERVTAINLRGVWNCMKYELRQMREQGSGAIVNCSSIGGLIGLPGRAAYHATKHGVIGLTKSGISETMGVSIVPGHTALIRIPREAYSRAANPGFHDATRRRTVWCSTPTAKSAGAVLTSAAIRTWACFSRGAQTLIWQACAMRACPTSSPGRRSSTSPSRWTSSITHSA